MKRITAENVYLYEKILKYIENNDLFWTDKLIQDLNLTGKEIGTQKRLLEKLRNKKLIQCCENKNSHKQYMVIGKININMFNI